MTASHLTLCVYHRTDKFLDEPLDFHRCKIPLSQGLVMLSRVALAAVLLLLCACGSHSQIAPPVNDDGTPFPPIPPPPIAASPTAAPALNAYFSTDNIGQTWTFQNGYGDMSKISIEAGPVVINGISVPGPLMHFTKKNARAWWQPGTDLAELWFPLVNGSLSANTSGWTSAGSKMDFPLGCWFCASFTHAEQNVFPSLGAYLIAPSGPFAVSTSYTSHWTRDDGASYNTTVSWRTDAVTGTVSSPLYTGPGLIVTVREGCEAGDTSNGCYFEEYDSAPSLGWVRVVPFNQGRGPVDPLLAMERVPNPPPPLINCIGLPATPTSNGGCPGN